MREAEAEAETSPLALERRFAGLAGRLPRFPLTTLPTPVARMAALGRECGRDGLWIKRDDRSGPAYGGNKPRKLELLVGDALRLGRRRLLTFGGIGTNHGLATAIAARSAGLGCVLVLVPQPIDPHVLRNLLLDHAYGAELHLAGGLARAAAKAAAILARGALRGDLPYFIPPGGTSRLGTLGYVSAGLELAEQVARGELPAPDAIFVPLGSGGTAAGLLLGCRLGGLHARIVAVLVTDILPPSASRLLRLACACSAHLRGLDPSVPAVQLGAQDLTVVAGSLGPGYGAPTEQAAAARRRMRDAEGIELETTYSAKCLAALLDGAGLRRTDRTVLFWNTFSSADAGRGVERPARPDELPGAFRRFFA